MHPFNNSAGTINRHAKQFLVNTKTTATKIDNLLENILFYTKNFVSMLKIHNTRLILPSVTT